MLRPIQCWLGSAHSVDSTWHPESYPRYSTDFPAHPGFFFFQRHPDGIHTAWLASYLLYVQYIL